MAEISIIVPVYNVQDYIKRCLDSILAQNFSDFEVICVDDGSKDSSGSICDEYAGKDSRIKVFHIENGGVGKARNYGLQKMCGNWFAFIDADDWIEQDYLMCLYDCAIKNACTVSACNFQRNTEYTVGCNREKNGKIILNSSAECIHNFICSKDSMQGMIWNKLYKSDVYKHIRFEAGMKVNEDCLYTYEIMKLCQKACYCQLELYHWFFRTESACHTKTIDKDFAPAEVFMRLYNETLCLQDAEVSDKLKKNYVGYVLKILLHAKYKRSDSDVKMARRQCKAWRKDVWSYMTVKERLKYIIAMYI